MGEAVPDILAKTLQGFRNGFAGLIPAGGREQKPGTEPETDSRGTLIVLPQRHFSTLAGGLALGVMMIPISLRTTEEFLRAVPQALREGAMALGASKSKAIITVVIPAAVQGIVTGIMLNIARVAGETAPLLFTSFSNRYWSPGWDQPTAALPVMVFNYAVAPYEDWHRQAWSAAFVLLMLVLTINVAARLVLARKGHSRR